MLIRCYPDACGSGSLRRGSPVARGVTIFTANAHGGHHVLLPQPPSHPTDRSHSVTLPALFLGHGNPLNALAQNDYTRAWTALGVSLPRPKAVLAISAHWYVPETGVTVTTAPRTIHDFGGFPRELYEVTYPAPGDPALARRVQQLLAPLP